MGKKANKPAKTKAAPEGVFSAVLASSKELRTILEEISYLIEETYLKAGVNGITLSAIDGNHVAMILTTLPKEMFSAYQCSEERKIGINVNDLVKILRRAKADDTVELRMEKDDKRNFLVKMDSKGSHRTFKLVSKDIQGYDAKEDGLLESFEESLKNKFTATVTLETGILEGIVKDAILMSDLMRIGVDAAEKVVTFKAIDSMGSQGELEAELDLGGAAVIDSEVKSDATGQYALNYLDEVVKLGAIAETFKLTLGVDIPMKIVATFHASAGDGQQKLDKPVDGTIHYLLAPRVDEDMPDTDMDETTDYVPAGDDEGKAVAATAASVGADVEDDDDVQEMMDALEDIDAPAPDGPEED